MTNSSPNTTRVCLFVCLFLVIPTLAVYLQTTDFDFVSYDDFLYVIDNNHVNSGLSWENTKWAFNQPYASYWHPLTWLSHMADCHFFGLAPGMHHLINIVLHLFNSLLLFYIFFSVTKRLWPCLFMAALFAMHPLHVESVAWISERKDLLSAFFWMLTTLCYIWYARQPCIRRYVFTLLLLCLSLMAQPMAVTLPFVLFLMDFWPIGRHEACPEGDFPRRSLISLIAEKIPFIALATASASVTFLVQQKIGAMSSFSTFSIAQRFGNAVTSYLTYIFKMIWPTRLVVFYPHPGMPPVWIIAFSVLFLVFMTWIMIRAAKSRPYLIIGWFWYLGILAPVIGIIQIGHQAMADRYTYLPLIGLFIMISWGLPELVKKIRIPRIIVIFVAAAILSIMGIMAWVQAGYWKNTITLFTHAIDAGYPSIIAHDSLGVAFVQNDQNAEAEKHFKRAIELNPWYWKSINNLGTLRKSQGRFAEAVLLHERALQLNPRSWRIYANYGLALMSLGKVDEAAVSFFYWTVLKPDNDLAHLGLGSALINLGKDDQAQIALTRALELNPRLEIAHNNLGTILFRKGNISDSVRHFNKALQIKPGYGIAQLNLNVAMKHIGISLMEQGQDELAIDTFKKAIALKPGDFEAMYNLACLYSMQNNLEQSAKWLEKALQSGFSDKKLLNADPDLENLRASVHLKPWLN